VNEFSILIRIFQVLLQNAAKKERTYSTSEIQVISKEDFLEFLI